MIFLGAGSNGCSFAHKSSVIMNRVMPDYERHQRPLQD
jgi:hypothetical protein